MALAIAFVLVATGALGQSTPPAGDEAARLLSSRSSVVYDLAMGSSSIRAGGAMVAINAPVAAVRAVITDYAHYQEIVPGFQRTRVVAKGPQGTDVYLAAPILHGAATLWAVTRFPPPVPKDRGSESKHVATATRTSKTFARPGTSIRSTTTTRSSSSSS